jgi:hypothetical protein
MTEETLAPVEPNALDGVELGAVGRQVERRDRRRPGQPMGDVPAGAVHDQHGMAVRRQVGGEFIKQRLHRRDARLGHDQRHASVALRADGAEDPGRFVAHVPEPARADAALLPDAAGAADLADPRLVMEPQLDRPAMRLFGGDPLQLLGERYLKRSRATGSALGWLGRVFC